MLCIEQGIPFISDRGHFLVQVLLRMYRGRLRGNQLSDLCYKHLRKPKLSLKDLAEQSRLLPVNAPQGGKPRLPSFPM